MEHDFGAPDFDWPKIKAGTIPWTADGYMEVLEYRMKLDRTPRDDWDLAPRRFALETEDEVRVFQFNMLRYENQIMTLVNQRYADRTTAASHLMRYFEMNFFLKKHERRFAREGFIRRAEDEPGQIEVNECLFRALAESPYTKTRGKGQHKHPTFDLTAIIARTRQLIAEEEKKPE